SLVHHRRTRPPGDNWSGLVPRPPLAPPSPDHRQWPGLRCLYQRPGHGATQRPESHRHQQPDSSTARLRPARIIWMWRQRSVSTTRQRLMSLAVTYATAESRPMSAVMLWSMPPNTRLWNGDMDRQYACPTSPRGWKIARWL